MTSSKACGTSPLREASDHTLASLLGCRRVAASAAASLLIPDAQDIVAQQQLFVRHFIEERARDIASVNDAARSTRVVEYRNTPVIPGSH